MSVDHSLHGPEYYNMSKSQTIVQHCSTSNVTIDMFGIQVKRDICHNSLLLILVLKWSSFHNRGNDLDIHSFIYIFNYMLLFVSSSAQSTIPVF